MKYISIDIETTGLDPEKHQILEFAAVYDDLENVIPIHMLPRFVRKICWEDFVISRHCLDLHGGKGLLQEIKDDTGKIGSNVIHIDFLAEHFRKWLVSLGINYSYKYNVAGKNFAGFDSQFVKKIRGLPLGHYRVIDVGSMYLEKSMSTIPGLEDIMDCAAKHRALDDALDVVRAIRKKLL